MNVLKVYDTVFLHRVPCALLKTNSPVEPYVVAWNYDECCEMWGFGHYFNSLKKARDYFTKEYVNWQDEN